MGLCNGVAALRDTRGLRGLLLKPRSAAIRTEHALQANQAGHKVIKVHGEVRITVASHQDLVQRVVQTEACRDTGGEADQVRLKGSLL